MTQSLSNEMWNTLQILSNWATIYYGNSDISQISKNSFSFIEFYNTEILNWIENECIYNYLIFTDRFTRKIHLEFIDIIGAVEFKLRFVNV